jgi:hypothetical protein
MDNDLAIEATDPTGSVVTAPIQNKIGAQTQPTYEEKLRVAERIVERFREAGIECELRWIDLRSQRR